MRGFRFKTLSKNGFFSERKAIFRILDNTSSSVHKNNCPFSTLPDFFDYRIDNKTGRLVRTTLRGVSKLSEEDRKKLKDPQAFNCSSSCLIPISIGQDYHYGPKLAATLNLVNHTFANCILVFGDTLQRYNRAIQWGKDPEYWRTYTKEEGAQWISNLYMLSELDIEWKVIRWERLLQSAHFPIYLDEIKQLYNDDPSYMQVFENNIDDFLQRMKKRGELNITRNLAKQYCRDYLFEECAIMRLWVQENCEFELYARTRSPAMQETWKRFIQPYNPDILKPISLNFKYLKNYTVPTANNQIIHKPPLSHNR